MMRAINRLSARGITGPPPGKHADGGGLWLVKREDGGAQWVLRVTIHGRRREMGLGSLLDVSLKEAREAADKWRASVRANVDPIKERERQRRETAKKLHILREIADDAFESRKAELKGDGKSTKTIRRWCEQFGIARQVRKNSPLQVSRIALDMVIHGDWPALERLKAGDRGHRLIGFYRTLADLD